LAVRRGTTARGTRRRDTWARGWRGRVKLLREEKEGQKAHRGGGGTGTESSLEAAMATGLALGCARWGKEERERGSGEGGGAPGQRVSR
jgi:hypothetical protein